MNSWTTSCTFWYCTIETSNYELRPDQFLVSGRDYFIPAVGYRKKKQKQKNDYHSFVHLSHVCTVKCTYLEKRKLHKVHYSWYICHAFCTCVYWSFCICHPVHSSHGSCDLCFYYFSEVEMYQNCVKMDFYLFFMFAVQKFTIGFWKKLIIIFFLFGSLPCRLARWPTLKIGLA